MTTEVGTFTWRHILYRFFNTAGDLLYVGRTNSITTRFDDHARKQPWWGDVADCTTEFHPDLPSLIEAELTAIRTENPLYNKAGRITAAQPQKETTMPGIRAEFVVDQIEVHPDGLVVDGQTVAQWIGPRLDTAYATNTMPELLPGVAQQLALDQGEDR